LAGFYFVGRGSWVRLVVCFLGFICARFLVMWQTRRPIEEQNAATKEASHAP